MIPSHQRPSHKELSKKLGVAREGILDSRWAPASPFKLLPELHSLQLFTAEDAARGLLEALSEISPEHYVGRRPPEKAYEKRVYGREMFAFCWSSRRFRCAMYLKFVVTSDTVYFVSFHKSRGEV